VPPDRDDAERLKLRAERDKLTATDPEGLAVAWAMIEDTLGATAARARELPEPVLHGQVDGEWSFVQTHRHLVLATDCWLRPMMKGSPARTTRGAWEGRGSRDLAAGASTRTPTRRSTRC
jgi:hypothetical protein